MPIGRLNHVGVATPSIEKSVEMYVNLLGATKVHEPFDLPPQGVRVCFVDTPNSQIELIEPLGENSPIVKFLETNPRSEAHTSDHQPIMRSSNAVYCSTKNITTSA